MKKFNLLLSLVVLMCLTTNFNINAQTIHLFMVIQEGNNSPASTTDKRIMLEEVKQIGRVTGMQVKEHIFEKQNRNIANALRNLNTGSDDVVWFYYSGHGANSETDEWPQFTGAMEYELSDIHDAIKNKNGRLKITMYDCCNITASTNGIASRPLPTAQYNFLFKQAQGDVKICSSEKGRESYGNASLGGFLTHSFLEAIRQVRVETPLEQKNIWKNLLELTYTNTNTLCTNSNNPHVKLQNPQYNINIQTKVGRDYAAPEEKSTTPKPKFKAY